MSYAIINKHYRDDYITFQEEGHIYTLQSLDIYYKFFLLKKLTHCLCYDVINNMIKNLVALTSKRPTSVTTLIHSLFPHFNADKVIKNMMSSGNWINSQYYGMTVDEIKEKWNSNGNQQSQLGSHMHQCIEDHINGKIVVNDTSEYKMFLKFWHDFQKQYPQFKPYRLEWCVHDETFRNDKGLCGSIDCVLSDDNDNIIILDWKRSKEIKSTSREKGYAPFAHMPNCNLSHYQLQLNIYRHLLETKYDKHVIFMMLCIFHPNQKTYQCIPVNKIELTDIWHTL